MSSDIATVSYYHCIHDGEMVNVEHGVINNGAKSESLRTMNQSPSQVE